MSNRDHNADTALPLFPQKSQDTAYFGDVIEIRFVQTTVTPCTSSCNLCSCSCIVYLIHSLQYLYIPTNESTKISKYR